MPCCAPLTRHRDTRCGARDEPSSSPSGIVHVPVISGVRHPDNLRPRAHRMRQIDAIYPKLNWGSSDTCLKWEFAL